MIHLVCGPIEIDIVPKNFEFHGQVNLNTALWYWLKNIESEEKGNHFGSKKLTV